jgi:hypothetical protein
VEGIRCLGRAADGSLRSLALRGNPDEHRVRRGDDAWGVGRYPQYN